MSPRQSRKLAAVTVAALVSLAVPSSAAAAVGPPVALLGIDVGDLVEEVIRGLVDLVVPDVASRWAVELVAWLVAMPELDPAAGGLLDDLRSQLIGVGYGLLGVSFVAAALQVGLGAPSSFHSGRVLLRTALAVGVLAAYPALLPAVLHGTNLLTRSITHSPSVTEGLDAALGGALVLGAAASGVSVGLAVAAVLACAYFVAALIVFKVGLSAALSILALAGGLIWGLFPLMPWLGRAWLSGLGTICLVTVVWSLVFATAAVLAGEAMPGVGTGADGATPTWLQQLMRPLTAAACFWLAYRTPGFLLAGIRLAGITPAGFIGGPLFGGSSHTRSASGSPVSRSAGSRPGIRRNHQRFASFTTSASGTRAATGRPAPASGRRDASRQRPTSRRDPVRSAQPSPAKPPISAAPSTPDRHQARRAGRSAAAPAEAQSQAARLSSTTRSGAGRPPGASRGSAPGKAHDASSATVDRLGDAFGTRKQSRKRAAARQEPSRPTRSSSAAPAGRRQVQRTPDGPPSSPSAAGAREVRESVIRPPSPRISNKTGERKQGSRKPRPAPSVKSERRDQRGAARRLP